MTFGLRRGALLLALAALALTGLARGEPAVRIVAGRGVGPMVLGQSPQKVAQEWGAPRQRPAKEGADYRWHEYPERGAWMLVFKGRIVRVGVEVEDYATAEGFRVGSKARAITSRWGPGTRRRAVPWTEQPDFEPDDEYDPHIPPERFFLDYATRGISFLVDTTLDAVVAIQVYPPRRS